MAPSCMSDGAEIPFSIYVKDVPLKLDVFELIAHFMDVPYGELHFCWLNQPEMGSIAYPKTFEELSATQKFVDPKKSVFISKPGLFLRYYPRGYSKQKDGGYQVFLVSPDVHNCSVAERITSMARLFDFPQEFVVYNHICDKYWEGREFFQMFEERFVQTLLPVSRG